MSENNFHGPELPDYQNFFSQLRMFLKEYSKLTNGDDVGIERALQQIEYYFEDVKTLKIRFRNSENLPILHRRWYLPKWEMVSTTLYRISLYWDISDNLIDYIQRPTLTTEGSRPINFEMFFNKVIDLISPPIILYDGRFFPDEFNFLSDKLYVKHEVYGTPKEPWCLAFPFFYKTYLTVVTLTENSEELERNLKKLDKGIGPFHSDSRTKPISRHQPMQQKYRCSTSYSPFLTIELGTNVRATLP